ncbi:bifunctional adenosylcobinamide kinase/adenosylcobinamide-phosphate guanylyltransferase [Taklimakanibacter lacteus]|uniref:bifunctional adenosylcobinamide kinase/adenosylcobinamide-phosphate guanylyltransferase n=1 Tax=Taklimakanibacter lacteus TaxID=2268456 RepID=UPI000E6755BC
MSQVTLILGGARSGKSRHAEGLAQRRKGQRVYIATAEITDEEMRERIALHRKQRGSGWKTVEAPLDLVGRLRDADDARSFILIDCITVWINNLMYHGRDVAGEVAELCALLSRMRARVVLVSNEVGLGIVPDTALGRAFRDEAGRANQALAQAADEVLFIAAGLPLLLKRAKPARRRARAKASKRGRRG